jgi:autotransporter-associated beta strand protein
VFGNVGVSSSRLFLGEDFSNTAAGVGYGRAGLSASDWDTVIQIRQDAIYNADYGGFLAYAWGGNPMGISEAEQIEHEYYYRSRLVLPTQKPQWLSDSAINVNGTTIPLSWNQPLNWLGGVPNASGAEANFWRTLTANRSITLDGSKTIGSLLFDSPFSYTITPGTGGSIIFNNGGSTATLTSNQGDHTLAVPVQLASSLNAAVNAGSVTISSPVTGSGVLTKSGGGTLVLSAANSYTGDTKLLAGELSLSTASLANGADVYLSTGSILNLNFSGSADVIDSLFINGASQRAGTWGAIGSAAQYTTALITGTGMLQVSSFIPPPLLGDYNQDGVVDAADYLLWRNSIGQASIPNRNPANGGVVGQADYVTWREHFGQSVLGGGAELSGAAVPEPASALLTCWLAFVAASARRARRR